MKIHPFFLTFFEQRKFKEVFVRLIEDGTLRESLEKASKTFVLKPGPESGLQGPESGPDCLQYTGFARQRILTVLYVPDLTVLYVPEHGPGEQRKFKEVFVRLIEDGTLRESLEDASVLFDNISLAAVLL